MWKKCDEDADVLGSPSVESLHYAFQDITTGKFNASFCDSVQLIHVSIRQCEASNYCCLIQSDSDVNARVLWEVC